MAAIITVRITVYYVLKKPPELKFRHGNGRFVSDMCCKQSITFTTHWCIQPIRAQCAFRKHKTKRYWQTGM